MSNERDAEQRAERALKELFAHAEPRPLPSAEDTEEIRRAVYAEWDAMTRPRQWQRRAGFGAAASVALAAAVWVGSGLLPTAPPVLVARVERVQGVIDTDAGVRLAVNGMLTVGDTISTRTGQLALRLASGGSLRIAPRSQVVLTSADAVELVGGKVYFDSENRRAGTAFSITTELGTVQDVGTQFIVNLDPQRAGLDVGVRDGRVTLTTPGAADTAAAGERLVAAPDAEAIRREPMPIVGEDWAWAEELAPAFDTNGRTVSEFLAWFERQTGRSVVYASEEVERLAREARVSGSIDRPPLQKLAAVLATTGDLAYVIEGDSVLIETR